jgi:hypothetical protein
MVAFCISLGVLPAIELSLNVQFFHKNEMQNIITFFIGVLSPSSGPQILSSWSASDDDMERNAWLLRFVLSDHDLPPHTDGRFDVKTIAVPQLECMVVTLLFRESTGNVSSDFSVPTYCCCFVVREEFKVRLSIVSAAVSDRLAILFQQLMTTLREADEQVVVVAHHLISQWRALAHDVASDLDHWLISFCTRGQVEERILEDSRLTDLLLGAESVARLSSVLTTCLSHRRVILRGSSKSVVEVWLRTVLAFFPDERLLMCSLSCSSGVANVVPELWVQGTTADIGAALIRRSYFSRFPTAIVDVDQPLHDACHVEPCCLTENPVALLNYALQRESVVLNQSFVPSWSLGRLSKTSSLVFDLMLTIERMLKPRIASDLRSNDSTSSMSTPAMFSSGNSFPPTHYESSDSDTYHWKCTVQRMVLPSLTRWRRSLEILALRHYFLEASVELRVLVQKPSTVDADIFSSLIDCTDVSLKVERQLNEVETKMDLF